MEIAIDGIRVIIKIGIIAVMLIYGMLLVAVGLKMENEIISELNTIVNKLLIIVFAYFIVYNILILANIR